MGRKVQIWLFHPLNQLGNCLVQIGTLNQWDKSLGCSLVWAPAGVGRPIWFWVIKPYLLRNLSAQDWQSLLIESHLRFTETCTNSGCGKVLYGFTSPVKTQTLELAWGHKGLVTTVKYLDYWMGVGQRSMVWVNPAKGPENRWGPQASMD